MHESVLLSLLWIAGAAALAPIIVGLLPGPRIPEVVLLLTLGIMIGPFGFELATKSEPIELLSELGLGLLFLLAGLEIDPASVASRTGARAGVAWVVSLAVAMGLMALLSLATELEAWAAIAIALTSTALGTLLPILRDTGLKDQPLGRAVMVNGAIGELGPILAMSLLLTGGNAWGALLSLVTFAVLAALINGAIVRHWTRAEKVVEIVRHGAETTAQAPLRLVVLLLVGMLALSTAFGLDIILGAFIAGATVRVLLPPDHATFMARLDGMAFGLLVPVFFVTSGMAIDYRVVLDRWGTVLVLFAMIVLIRGLPVYLAFRDLPGREPVRVALFSATGLPIIVAVTTVAVTAGSMTIEGQSLVVAAGMLTVLVLPLLAVELGNVRPRSPAPG
ncbi:cation:proton antiporter [Nocardioides sp.]|uniref:cation:proton antiporter n=1 Tax=Nocardioides sp. TaxID=35761 RepID=UPI003D0DB37E